MVKKYGQTVLVTQDIALENYLDKYVSPFPCLLLCLIESRILKQVQSQWLIDWSMHFLTSRTEWLLTGSVTQLVLAIISKDSRTPLERWVFDIKLVEPPADSNEP